MYQNNKPRFKNNFGKKRFNRSPRDREPDHTCAVYAYEGEELESLLRRFNKKVDAADVMLSIKKKEYFETPNQRRRRKKFAAKKRVIKNLLKAQEFENDFK